MSGSAAANDNTSLTLDSNTKSHSRRRSVAAVEKKLTAELLARGGTNGFIDDNGKDLGRADGKDVALERPKDPTTEVKKGVVASPVSALPRRKKHVQRSEKPKWVTVLSVLTKNCLLLACLLWLGQMVWKWSDRIGENPGNPFADMDYEDRISGVEESLKKTAKMLQIQLEVVDRKIGNEIEAVTGELRQVEEKGLLLDKELRKLEARADNLDESLGELKDMHLSREEFENLWKELKNSGSLDGGDKAINLDNVRAIAREIVAKEIEKHAADGLGRVDYALASAGAKVVRHSEPYVFGAKANNWLTITKGRSGVHPNAHKMLEPSFGEPGQCFPLKGSGGFVEIKLKTGILPEAVTLEHVSKHVAYDRSSAPKDCRVSAWFEAPDDDTSNRTEKMLLLAEFSYDLEKSNAQTFDVENANLGVVNMVRFDFTSNHGNHALTCIYRMRVHGSEPNAAAAMAMQS